MNTRVPAARHPSAGAGERGLPDINYHLPIVATLLASLFLFLLLGFFSLIAIFNVITELGREASQQSEGSVVMIGLCGVVGLLCLAGTAYVFTAVVKGVRDLLTPVYYTRATVSDKRSIGGRKVGNWLAVQAHYAGPDLAAASSVGGRHPSKERSEPGSSGSAKSVASPDNSAGGYLPKERIAATGSTPIENSSLQRVVFRIDPVSHAGLEAGEEVLLAHSRYLQHIFYVARLKGGEWESFRNKTLI